MRESKLKRKQRKITNEKKRKIENFEKEKKMIDKLMAANGIKEKEKPEVRPSSDKSFEEIWEQEMSKLAGDSW